MIKGLYSAASAMVAGMKRQNALAHNIANLDTPGFRQILLAMDDWYVSPAKLPSEEILPAIDVNHIHKVGYTGLGTETSPEIIDFSQGDIKETGNEFDFAIQGTGFFRIQTPNGERYTRDGRFIKDLNGNVVTLNGYFVLDKNGQPIKLTDNVRSINVSEDGTISSNGQTLGQLGLAAFTAPETELTRDGDNTFAAAGGLTGQNPGTIHHKSLEMTNSNVEALMTQMIIVGRAYEAAQRVVQMEDDTTNKLISSLSR